MLAGATRCRDTYGLDRSGEFLAGARQEFGQYTFLEHDVTQVPFPVTPDVMYCRFVRSHLKHPVEIINRWLTQLQPRGFLFVDELNDIDSRLPVFTTYLSMAESIIAEQGAALYVGETLSSGEYNAQVLLNEATTIEVSDRKAASWFLSNTKTIWRLNGYVHSRLSPGERQDIEHLLENIMTSRKTESHITWKLRRRIRISWC